MSTIFFLKIIKKFFLGCPRYVTVPFHFNNRLSFCSHCLPICFFNCHKVHYLFIRHRERNGIFKTFVDCLKTSIIQMYVWAMQCFAVLLSKLVSEHARRSCSETILETTLQKHFIPKTSELPRSNLQ